MVTKFVGVLTTHAEINDRNVLGTIDQVDKRVQLGLLCDTIDGRKIKFNPDEVIELIEREADLEPEPAAAPKPNRATRRRKK